MKILLMDGMDKEIEDDIDRMLDAPVEKDSFPMKSGTEVDPIASTHENNIVNPVEGLSLNDEQ
jgi:hypothetical protein